MLGASLWSASHSAVSHIPSTPEPFVVVGMMALFGGVARAPLAVMLMVGEMTDSYAMLIPAMIAVSISYVVVGRNTIYESQVESPALSPAHKYEYSFPILRQIKVKDAMTREAVSIPLESTAEEAQDLLQTMPVKSLLVLDHAKNNNIAGIVTLKDTLQIPRADREETSVSKIMSSDVVSTNPEESLDTILELMAHYDIASLPVVVKESGSKLVGIISRYDVSRAYTKAAKRLLNMLCFNGSRTASFRKKCDTSSRRRYNKTKPGGVMTWIEIKADA
jgi:CIC family chloride channel protein